MVTIHGYMCYKFTIFIYTTHVHVSVYTTCECMRAYNTCTQLKNKEMKSIHMISRAKKILCMYTLIKQYVAIVEYWHHGSFPPLHLMLRSTGSCAHLRYSGRGQT